MSPASQHNGRLAAQGQIENHVLQGHLKGLSESNTSFLRMILISIDHSICGLISRRIARSDLLRDGAKRADGCYGNCLSISG